MPLSEYHRPTAKDKPEATQSRGNNCSSDLFSMPDHEFAELLWENGQVVIQGHSSRPKKSSFPTTFSSHATGVEEKDRRDAIGPKTSRFYAMDPMVNDFSPSGHSAHIGVNAQDDDMVPWINYPTEEPLTDDNLQNDYCLEFLNEFMGANLNSHSACSKPMPTDRSGGLGQHASKALTESKSSEPSRVRTSQLFQLSQHCQSSAPSSKSGAIDKAIGDGAKTHLQSKIPAGPKPLQLNGSSMLNFSHFSRPAMLAKANLHGADRPRSNEKVSTPSNSNLVESTLIQSTSGFKSATGVQGRSTSGPPKMELQSSAKPPQEVISVEHLEAICQDASRKNHTNILTNNCGKQPDQLASSSVMASGALRRQETEKAPEAVVASSSMCSANNAGAASNDPKQREKRKSHEEEESGYQSDDFEDVSVELKKPATGRGTSAKRSRAAEVHNLSERRRRDRINEKMRALQELIPNCNKPVMNSFISKVSDMNEFGCLLWNHTILKADKASMLEEAIEYLKTLQMQVQIMSMNTGLCMPPMLLPPGMQHMHAPAMARFLPTGVGMGMGMGFGYGMGMYDMNGSPSCSMIPAPPFHGPQFPCPSIPGPLGLHGMPGSVKHQMFGVPGQGIPLSMPRPSPSGLSVKENSVPEITAPMTCAITASDAAPASISEDQQHQNIEALQRSNIDNSQMQNPNQEVKEPF